MKESAQLPALIRFQMAWRQCPPEPRDPRQREIAAKQLGWRADHLCAVYHLEPEDALLQQAMDDFDREFGA